MSEAYDQLLHNLEEDETTMGRGKVRPCNNEPGSFEIQVGSYYEVFTREESIDFALAILTEVRKSEKEPHRAS